MPRYSTKELQAKMAEISGAYSRLPIEVTDQQVKYMRSQISVALQQYMSSDERHRFLRELTGQESTKEMPNHLLRALHRWLFPKCRGGLDAPAYEDKQYEVDENSIEEIKVILSEIALTDNTK